MKKITAFAAFCVVLAMVVMLLSRYRSRNAELAAVWRLRELGVDVSFDSESGVRRNVAIEPPGYFESIEIVLAIDSSRLDRASFQEVFRRLPTLTHVRGIQLSGREIGDAEMLSLVDLSRLESISVVNTSVTTDGLMSLFAGTRSPSVNSLTIYGCDINPGVLNGIELTTLNLDCRTPSKLYELPDALSELSLSHCEGLLANDCDLSGQRNLKRISFSDLNISNNWLKKLNDLASDRTSVVLLRPWVANSSQLDKLKEIENLTIFGPMICESVGPTRSDRPAPGTFF